MANVARRAFSEVVEAEGHLIDSQILNVVFDTVVKCDASFEVLQFTIGRSNDEPSSISMRISAPTEQVLGAGARGAGRARLPLAEQHDALLKPADRDGCVPDDFYSTTNHRTLVRHGGHWLEVERQRMDAVIVVGRRPRAPAASCATSAPATRVVCGVDGVRVMPEFQERDRLGFAFMTNEISSERRVEVGVSRIAAMMRDVKAAGGADRVRRRPGGRAHRRRRRTSRS